MEGLLFEESCAASNVKSSLQLTCTVAEQCLGNIGPWLRVEHIWKAPGGCHLLSSF
jgi:hypothetical protein